MKFFLTTIGLFFLAGMLSGQSPFITIDDIEWERVTGPPSTISATAFAEMDGRLWAAANGNLFFSDDAGENWQQKPPFNEVVNIFTGTFGLVIVSQEIINIPTEYTRYYHFNISHDNGETFTGGDLIVANASSTHTLTESRGFYQPSDSVLLHMSNVGAHGGPYYIFKSLMDDGSWPSLHNLYPPPNFHYRAFSAHQDTTLSLQLIDSVNWELTTTSFTFDTNTLDTFQLPPGYDFNSYNFKVNHNNGRIFITFHNGNMIYGDLPGNNWTTLNYPFSNLEILGIKFFDDVFQVNTPGQLWEVRFDALDNATLVFQANGNGRLAFNKTENYSFVADHFNTYLKPEGASDYEVRSNSNTDYISAVSGGGDVIWVRTGRWFRSHDYGETWTAANNFPGSNGALTTVFNNIFYFVNSSNTYRSIDNGVNWELYPLLNGATKFLETGNKVFAYGNDNLYESSDGINFTEQVHPQPGAEGQLVKAGNQLFYFVGNKRHLSLDDGLNWIDLGEMTTALPGTFLSVGNELVNFGRNSFRGVELQTSQDEGTTWVEEGTVYPVYVTDEYALPIFVKQIDSLLFFNGNGFEVTQNSGQTIATLNSPFHFDFGQFDGTRPGPTELFSAGAFLFGYSEETSFYRTSINILKDQVPEVFSPEAPHVAGRLFKDLNNSCTFDSLDTPLANKVIQIADGYAATDENGFYKIIQGYNAFANYSTAPVRHTEIICATSNSGTFDHSNRFDTLNILFQPIPNTMDGSVAIFSSNVFQPGQTARIKIKVTNMGTVPIEDQILEFKFNSNYQSIAQASAGAVIDADTWQFPVNLDTDEATEFWIDMGLNMLLTPNIELSYTATLLIPEEADAYPSDNQFTYSPTLASEHLFNECFVNTDTLFLPQQHADLVYRIRFQNTGNDTAHRITILDTLPSDLDIFNFEMLEASHPYSIELDDRYNIKWLFDNINLPGSNTNEAASKGHLIFKIKTKGTLVANQRILNSAWVYFDTNEPVLTNESVTTVKKQTTIIQDSLEICYGDRFNDSFITGDRLFSETVSTPDYDTIYQTFVTALPVYNSDTLIFAAPGDLIEGIAVYSDTIIRHELLSIHNCDSIVSFLIKMTTTGISDLDNASFNVSIHPNPNNGTAQLTLNLNDPATLSATWFKATGQQLLTAIHHQPIPDRRHEIPLDLSGFTTGIYFLKIETKAGVKWLKVIRN